MTYRGIFEYEYPTEHKPPVSIDVHLHGDCVKGKIIEWEYRPLEQEQSFKWCTGCKEYDQEKHCCHRWSKVIRDTVEEMKQEQEPKPMVEIDLYSVIKQKYIEREVLDKIKAELLDNVCEVDTYEYNYLIPKNLIDRVIDKYKAESEDKE